MTTSDSPDVIDLTDSDGRLLDRERSDAIHRADFPRSAIAQRHGSAVIAVVTAWAADVADAHCGVPPGLPAGPHLYRGTLRWYRYYIAHLDNCADLLVPGWREEDREKGPYPWCDVAFGSISPHGRQFPPPSPNAPGYSRDPEVPRVVGYWTFRLPQKEVLTNEARHW